MKIPDKGMNKDELFKKLNEYRSDDLNWRTGKTWGYVYDAGREAEDLCKQAYMMFLTENALDPTVYPSLLRFETELVEMARTHLRGNNEVVGNFTSGGTESIILTVKVARDRARALRPDVSEPEMILPVTSHAAFHKAAHYLCVKPIMVPVDHTTFKADVDEVRKAITRNTILLVGSAPSYAHGVVDPIRELGQLALERDLLLHVDGCIGAFLLPYFRRLGEVVPDFDFTVPGVTSISMDLHKYAYAAKGASLVLYRNKELRQYQIFTLSGWTGYTMINSTVQSSKSGGPLAAAWAILNFIGDEGYLEIARSLLDATQRIIKGVEEIEDLYILGKPEMSLLAVASDTVNVFEIVDEMKIRGWYIQPQLALEDYKENIHLSVSPPNVAVVDDLIKNLRESVDAARSKGPSDLVDTAKDMFSSIDPDELTNETLTNMLGMAGIEGFAIPERMADINGILNALPPKLADRLLTVFFNELVQYRE